MTVSNLRGAGDAAALLSLLLLSLVPAVRADVSLPPLISDGMVLQQKIPLRFVGRADPGESVRVELAGRTATVVTDANGRWMVRWTPLPAGGPHTLVVSGKNRLVVRDILVGEVWVCSGQSNMGMRMASLKTGKEEIVRANDPYLRMFTVSNLISRTPKEETAGGRWEPALPSFVGGFSAVGYHFGKSLRAARRVPIGLIHTSWGGTRIEAWMSRTALESVGTPPEELATLDPDHPPLKEALARYQKRLERWRAAGTPQGGFDDPGIAPEAQTWSLPEAATPEWLPVTLPSPFDEAGPDELKDINGGVWFRRTFTLPPEFAGKELKLTLGPIDDVDVTFVNGVRVGATGRETPNWWQHPRVYKIPAERLKPGENVLAVRVWDTEYGGGFMGKPEEMRLTVEGDPARYVPLAGEWTFRVERARPTYPGPPPGETNPNLATGLYNAMVHPLRHYAIAGVIWYQGEANAPYARRYREQLPALIADWRREFEVGDFPFLIVQLAPFSTIRSEPAESQWAALREVQWRTGESVPRTGTAVITDLGDEKDIHPQRKGPVGERLAMLARKIAYGEPVAAISPSFKTMKVETGKVFVTFKMVGPGLEARATDTAGKTHPPGTVVGFSVAGRDGRFVRADARIVGQETVVVSSPEVPEPVAVRFGWADYPVVNLYSRNGLPVAPFRTDQP
ncbi:MAG: sialate O-acetylesterase [Capsulimonadales bacterium]|nr:sialate O-acetylesterase [Capsulimonadales bacterium]